MDNYNTVSIYKINKTTQRLLTAFGRKPLPEEVATELGIDVLSLQFLGKNIDWSNLKKVIK